MDEKDISKELNKIEDRMVPTSHVISGGIISSAILSTAAVYTANQLGYIGSVGAIGLGTMMFSTGMAVSLLITLANHIENKDITRQIEQNNKLKKTLKKDN